jgi:hypothetical protein
LKDLRESIGRPCNMMYHASDVPLVPLYLVFMSCVLSVHALCFQALERLPGLETRHAVAMASANGSCAYAFAYRSLEKRVQVAVQAFWSICSGVVTLHDLDDFIVQREKVSRPLLSARCARPQRSKMYGRGCF